MHRSRGNAANLTPLVTGVALSLLIGGSTTCACWRSRPRGGAYDVCRYQAELPEQAPMTAQQRAYTSPIWYTP